jgi:hypothetical protein
MTVFLAPECWPFLIATVILLAITILEGLSLLVGFSASHWIDNLLPNPADGSDAFDSILGWLHVGKVPLLILLVIFLAGFAVSGFALNVVTSGLLGVRVPPIISVTIAVIASLPIVRGAGATIARLIPKDQTYAVSLDSLVGRVATILSGTARQGFPAQAKVTSEYGQTLYVMVEPESAGSVFPSAESVLLIRRVAGTRFQAIRNPKPDLL